MIGIVKYRLIKRGMVFVTLMLPMTLTLPLMMTRKEFLAHQGVEGVKMGQIVAARPVKSHLPSFRLYPLAKTIMLLSIENGNGRQGAAILHGHWA